ncbi:hypothetical protein [Sphingomonas aerophila]|uniref:Uncharacterized protein n=1 Tax=Sphingomonas aerophila TaxID=1344948 RepID=A0A7W9ETP3_9SPHN|nr:hypothetical protein [Sphingomonas aerophila]MBB5714350.1 hypothetical protein [Sphingomonas aerophila]
MVIAAALVAMLVAMTLVRLGWGAQRAMAVGGWSLAALSLVVLAGQAGAWGLATGTLAAMIASVAMVLRAGWSAPVRVRRPAREPASVTMPRRPRDLARRLAVFTLVVPGAFVGAQALAFGAQALVRQAGGGEANAIVLMLFLQPLLWGGLMTWQMTRSGPIQMIGAPVGASALGALMWSLG